MNPAPPTSMHIPSVACTKGSTCSPKPGTPTPALCPRRSAGAGLDPSRHRGHPRSRCSRSAGSPRACSRRHPAASSTAATSTDCLPPTRTTPRSGATWAGREAELYRRCFDITSALGPADVERLIGVRGRALLEAVRAGAIASTPSP